MRYTLSKFAQRDIGIGEIGKPSLLLGLIECDPRGHAETRGPVCRSASPRGAYSSRNTYGTGGMRSARRLKTSLIRSSNLLSVSLAFRFSFMISAVLNVSACEFEGQQITCNHTVTYRDLVSSHEPFLNCLF